MNFIEIDRLSMTYKNGYQVFSSVFASFDKGTLTFLKGETGSGKTTLLNLLMTLLKPSLGRVLVESVDIHKLKGEQVARYRRNVGFIPQRYSLLDQRTLYENIAMPLWAQGLDGKAVSRRMQECLRHLALEEHKHQYPPQLSSGIIQRGVIARAIANQPLLLLADEPTGALDSELSDTVMSILRDYTAEGGTVIVAMHDESQIKPHDRVLQLANKSVTEPAN